MILTEIIFWNTGKHVHQIKRYAHSLWDVKTTLYWCLLVFFLVPVNVTDCLTTQRFNKDTNGMFYSILGLSGCTVINFVFIFNYLSVITPINPGKFIGNNFRNKWLTPLSPHDDTSIQMYTVKIICTCLWKTIELNLTACILNLVTFSSLMYMYLFCQHSL